jgi:hypothetical protein
MDPPQIKDEDSKLSQDHQPYSDPNTALKLQELIDLQKALLKDLHDPNDNMEESSIASSQTFSYVQSDDSFFSSYRELLTENNNYGNICIDIYMHIYIHLYINMHVCMYVYIYMYMHIYMHVYICTYIHLC